MRRFERKVEFDDTHSTVKQTEEAIREVVRLLLATTGLAAVGEPDTP